MLPRSAFTLANELPVGTYFLTGTAQDGLGNSRVLTPSRFVTAAAAAMSQMPANCGTCHTTAGHPGPASCITCHAGDDHGSGIGCAQSGCHAGQHANGSTPCASCHSASGGLAPGQHTAVSAQPKHQSSCDGCHVGSLIDRHGAAPAGSAYAFQCDSCHESTNPRVVAAIADGVTTCSACHDAVPGHGYDVATHAAGVGQTADPSGKLCSDCHYTDLAAEHDKAASTSTGVGCVTCHPTPRAPFAAWGDTCSQGGCHAPGSPTAAHAGMTAAHASPDSGAGCGAAGCHPGDVSALHSGATTTTAGVTRTSCSVCHDLVATPTKDCVTCHPGRVEPHGYEVSDHVTSPPSAYVWISNSHEGVGPVGVQSDCIVCHNTELGPVHLNACPTCHPAPRNTFAT
jgi:ribosomal protein L37AE/L43A